MATYVLDDLTDQFSTGNTVGESKWVEIQGSRFFGGSAIYPPFAGNSDDTGDSGNYGTLKVTFQGTSIAFIGNTPPSGFSQNIFVSIDGGPSYQTWYNDPSPPCALQWYQSPKLSDGTHTISITHIAGTSVDMMMVTAGQNTPLSGKRLIVDDGDGAITYSGNWARKTGLYSSSDAPHTGQPYGNATHQSSSVGASAIFRFTGTSVSVYSVFDYSHLGAVGVTYTLDSSASGRTYVVASDTPEYTGGTLQRENTLLWSSGTISAGDHTLKIEVTSSTNGAALVLDYLLYTPSFDTLAKNGGSAQPAQPAQAVTSGGTSSPSAGITSGQATSTSGSGSGTESSTVSSGVSLSSYTTVISGSTVYGTVTLSGAGGGTTSAASAISEPGTSSAKGVPIGAVVGGVVGGVALLGIALLLVFCRKRLVRRKSSDLTPAGTPAAILPPIEPFTGSPRSSSARLTAPIEKGRQAPYPIVVPAARSNTHTLSENSYPSSSGESNVPSTPSQWQSPSVNTYPPSSAQGSVHEMNDLQSLISEFNRATQVHGEANLRVVELQNRIAEIAQQATVDRGSAHLGKHEMLSTMAVPPPYEMN